MGTIPPSARRWNKMCWQARASFWLPGEIYLLLFVVLYIKDWNAETKPRFGTGPA